MEQQAMMILVNERDEPLGVGEKMDVHRRGLLHRAFSVFLFDRRGHMLLQRRALQKYHGGGLWTNACCSHPYPGEEVPQAAARRLGEELGISAPLHKIFDFTYRAEVENGLTEHEYDHVFAGQYEGDFHPNPAEVADYCYEDMDSLASALQQRPQAFTTWFRLAYPQVRRWWEAAYGTQKVNT